MGVMTTKEMGMTGSSIAKKERESEGVPSPIKEQKVKIINQMVFRLAQMGKSNVAFYDSKGKTKQLDLVDKIYKFPKNLSPGKIEILRRELLGAGFEDISYSEDEEVKIVKKEPEKKIMYVFGHPDNEPNKPKEGNFAIKIKGEEMQFTLEDGCVRTEDKKVARALSKMGFYDVAAIESKESSEKKDKTQTRERSEKKKKAKPGTPSDPELTSIL